MKIDRCTGNYQEYTPFRGCSTFIRFYFSVGGGGIVRLFFSMFHVHCALVSIKGAVLDVKVTAKVYLSFLSVQYQ